MATLRFKSLVTAGFLSALVALSGVVQAATPVVTDSRIRTYVYNPNEVFKLITEYGYQSNIEFGEDEYIQTLSVGDVAGFKITPAGNRLFVRALQSEKHTNMTVITNERVYQLELSSFVDKDEDIVYVLRFYYPEEDFDPVTGQPVSDSRMAMAAPAPGGFGAQPAMMAPSPIPPQPAAQPMQQQGGQSPYPAASGAPSFVPPAPPSSLGYQNLPSPPKNPLGQRSIGNTLQQMPRIQDSIPQPPSMTQQLPLSYTPVTPVEQAPLPDELPVGPPPAAPDAPVSDELSSADALSKIAPAASHVTFVATTESGDTPEVASPAPGGGDAENKNYNYTLEGPEAISPWQVFDDGKATYLRFSENVKQTPTIQEVAEDGTTRPLTVYEKVPYLYVEGVFPSLQIELGQDRVTVYNEVMING